MDADIKNDAPAIMAANIGTADKTQSTVPMMLALSYCGAKASRRSFARPVTPYSVSMACSCKNSYARTDALHCMKIATAAAMMTSSAMMPMPPAKSSRMPNRPASLSVPSASSGMGLMMQSAVASASFGALACVLAR